MGVLKHIATGKTVILPEHAVAGRALSSAIHLADHAASNDHASVFWAGQRWEARDLASTNGTFVDDVRLQSRENRPLSRGSILRFGCENERWELVDDRGPTLAARSLDTGEIRFAEGGALTLPVPENALVKAIEDPHGKWYIEAQGEARRPAMNLERITVAGQRWELTVPQPSPGGTYKAKTSLSLSTLTLRFFVTRDEKHVRIEACEGDQVVQMDEKANFSLLLKLARKRLDDARDATLPQEEHGWMHVIDLLQSPAKEESTLNVHVKRAREEFARTGIEGAEGIIQRRPREVRIGTGRLEVKSL